MRKLTKLEEAFRQSCFTRIDQMTQGRDLPNWAITFQRQLSALEKDPDWKKTLVSLWTQLNDLTENESTTIENLLDFLTIHYRGE